MARGKLISKEKQQEVIQYYLGGHSTVETGEQFNISNTYVANIVRRSGISVRSVAEGNSLKWNNDDFRNNQVQKRLGKPSGALGKNWIIDHVVRKPTLKGKNNHFWKGGKTELSLSIRELPEYRFWRKAVFERDWFSCQFCGRKRIAGDRVIIQADHIVPLSKLIDANEIKNVDDAVRCEKLWDINNGRTLCKECHKKTITFGCNRHKNRKKDGFV
jgi:hypothetical protein